MEVKHFFVTVLGGLAGAVALGGCVDDDVGAVNDHLERLLGGLFCLVVMHFALSAFLCYLSFELSNHNLLLVFLLTLAQVKCRVSVA